MARIRRFRLLVMRMGAIIGFVEVVRGLAFSLLRVRLVLEWILGVLSCAGGYLYVHVDVSLRICISVILIATVDGDEDGDQDDVINIIFRRCS